MAGSYSHCTDEEHPQGRVFKGVELLDDLGDAYEALEEMWFVMHLTLNDEQIDSALRTFHAACRGERVSRFATEVFTRTRDYVDDPWFDDDPNDESEVEK